MEKNNLMVLSLLKIVPWLTMKIVATHKTKLLLPEDQTAWSDIYTLCNITHQKQQLLTCSCVFVPIYQHTPSDDRECCIHPWQGRVQRPLKTRPTTDPLITPLITHNKTGPPLDLDANLQRQSLTDAISLSLIFIQVDVARWISHLRGNSIRSLSGPCLRRFGMRKMTGLVSECHLLFVDRFLMYMGRYIIIL